MQDKKNAPTLTAGEQAILDHITQERINADNHVNSLIEELRSELKEDKSKLDALQKGVSNLQSVKTDMKQVKQDVKEIKTDTDIVRGFRFHLNFKTILTEYQVTPGSTKRNNTIRWQ